METLYGTLGLRETTQGRTNLRGCSLEKVSSVYHIAVCCGAGLSSWADNRPPSGVQAGEPAIGTGVGIRCWQGGDLFRAWAVEPLFSSETAEAIRMHRDRALGLGQVH